MWINAAYSEREKKVNCFKLLFVSFHFPAMSNAAHRFKIGLVTNALLFDVLRELFSFQGILLFVFSN